MTLQERAGARIAHVETALRETAREAGCSVGALECLWFGSRDGQRVQVVGRFMGGRPRQPRGYTSACRAGLVVPRVRLDNAMFAWVWSVEITPEGRRALWRLHERLAEVDGE
jgi:hypothetical protein